MDLFHWPTFYHPLVVHFPVALWLTSALFDILYLRSGDRFHFRASMGLIGLGLLAAIVSIVTGYIDYLPAVAEGIGKAFVDQHKVHQLFAASSTVVYLASFLIRWRRPAVGRGAIVAFIVVGVVLISAAGYLGGEMRVVM